MDSAIGQFYINLRKNTVLIITSDHGEEFGEYGEYSHRPNKFIAPLQEVPLIMNENSERYKDLDFYDLINEISEEKT
jgi:glucan phosphoethanolaminetransferase (alkaline phosphatase superfamily)